MLSRKLRRYKNEILKAITGFASVVLVVSILSFEFPTALAVVAMVVSSAWLLLFQKANRC